MKDLSSTEQKILLRIFMRLIRLYGEAALTRRFRGTWLRAAAELRVRHGRPSRLE